MKYGYKIFYGGVYVFQCPISGGRITSHAHVHSLLSWSPQVISQIVDVEALWLKNRRLIVLGLFAVVVLDLDFLVLDQILLFYLSQSEKLQKCP